MNVRKFSAATSRAALHEVKKALGPDAVILSNRSIEGGVEILAMGSQKELPAEKAKTPSIDGMAGELRALRTVLQEQLGGLVWGETRRREPAQAALMRNLLQAGFGPMLARSATRALPEKLEGAEAARWLQATLARNLPCAEEEEIVTQGGVYALLGPTGVGKTTTTAKLAARCVVRYGAEKVALLTTDGYRIGAHEHLRIYGKILGVAVHAVADPEDLGAVLAALAGKHAVLIDTIGMSQRDQQVAAQVAMLCGAGKAVKRLLLLNAASQAAALEESVRAYQGESSGEGDASPLHGAILTKTDEAVSLGGALDVLIRHKLKLHYVATGQRVPEDLHLANREHLVHRALAPRPAQPALDIEDLDMPALLGAA